MNARVPATSSGTAIHHDPVSRSPNALMPRPRKIAICTSAISTVTTTRAPTTDPAETGESWSRRSSLLLRHPWRVAAAPNAALIATAQPSRPGRHELDGLQRLVLDPLAGERVARRLPGRVLVGAVDEGVQGALGDRRLHLVGLRVVRDQRVALHLDRRVGVALADLAQRAVEVVGWVTSKVSSKACLAPGREPVDEGDVADLDDRRSWAVLVVEHAAEQHQEHQREDEREEQRHPVAQEALDDGQRDRHEGRLRCCSCAVLPPGEVRGTRPRGWPPCTAARSARSRSASRVSTAAGCRVVSTSAPPSSSTRRRRRGWRSASSSVELAAARPLIRIGASSPRTSAAGVSSCRIRPWSMIATRSHSASASSM